MNLLEFCMWSAAETKSITAEETIKELKERIDKAIGHINACGCVLTTDESRYLLEILKGSDKE